MSIKLPVPFFGQNDREQASTRKGHRQDYDDHPCPSRGFTAVMAARGITGRGGMRAVPSAGVGLYPLELYCVAGAVDGRRGRNRYALFGHELIPVVEGESRESLAAGSLGQKCVRYGAASK